MASPEPAKGRTARPARLDSHRSFILLTLLTVLCAADTKSNPKEEQAIRKVLADGTAAFNRHEIVPASVAKDFDIVVPPAIYSKAGPEFETTMKRDFSGIFKSAKETATIERIRFIKPDVALVDGTFEIAGTEIKPYPKGLQTLVLVKENGRWLVTAMRRMIPVAMPAGMAPTKP